MNRISFPSWNRSFVFALPLAVPMLVVALWQGPAHAQAVSSLPRAEYYLAKELFGAGRMQDAADGFRAALAGARRVGEARWVDSVPPNVMLGECYYQQGNLSLALQHYDAALMLVLSNPDWIGGLQVELEQLPLLEGSERGIDWFQPSRPVQPVAVPEALQIAIDPTQAEPGPGGTIVAPVSLVTRLDTTEVFRTLALALMRRAQIFGPLAEHSPLSQPMADYFATPPPQRVAWIQASWQALRAISQLSTRNPVAARQDLRSSALLQDQFCYFLSPIVLLALSGIEADDGNLQNAIEQVKDASLFAAYYEQHWELAESLQMLGQQGSIGRRSELAVPIQKAASWASNRSVLAFASASVAAVGLYGLSNDYRSAERMLQQATNGLRPRDVLLPRLQAALAFETSRLAFAQQKRQPGLTNLDLALKLMRGTTQTGVIVPRVYQTQMILDLLAGGQLTMADAEALLTRVLDEPGPLQWQGAPLEHITAMTTSSLPAYERHLELASARGDLAAVFQRMDRIQRQRFFEKLPMGGRLLSWRSVTQRPAAQFPKDVQDAVAKAAAGRPSFQASSNRLAQLVDEIQASPLAVDEKQMTKDQRALLKELQDVRGQLENELAFQALSRNYLPRIAPMPADQVALQSTLADGDVLVAYVVTSRKIFGAALTKDQAEFWEILDLGAVNESLRGLLSNMGAIRQVPPKLPSRVLEPTAAWRKNAADLQSQLLPDVVQELVQSSQRVIVVPSSFLWYVPFELMPNLDHASESWLASRRFCYLPTIGSIGHAFSAPQNIESTVGLVGNTFATNVDRNAVLGKQVIDAVPNTAAIVLSQQNVSSSPAWIKLVADQLWVTSKVDLTQGWDATALPLGGLETGLGRWLDAPLTAPMSIAFPNAVTSISTGQVGNGDDLFLAACTATISGANTTVFSRWSVGGVSTATVLKRFLRERKLAPASLALRRAIIAMWPRDFLVADEPALLPAGKEAEALTLGEHPLLWANYLIVGDTAAPQP